MAEKDKPRRRFLDLCTRFVGLAAFAPELLAVGAERPLRTYPKTLLTDQGGSPLDCERLEPESEYVFHYPYRTTPCFLIDLGRELNGGTELRTEAGAAYRSPGGVGPNHSLVAFSAICAHRMTHPSPAVSFIGYRRETIGYLDQDLEIRRRAGVIQCCSEGSVYDPAAGARVLGGPAPQPLAAIALSFEEGRLFAIGVYGGELFEDFFVKFGNRLITEYETLDIKQPTGDRVAVAPMSEFTERLIECS